MKRTSQWWPAASRRLARAALVTLAQWLAMAAAGTLLVVFVMLVGWCVVNHFFVTIVLTALIAFAVNTLYNVKES